MQNRPPIVAVMGHIDHGKSTLLDYIRQANTTGKEAGGITQHVAAYEAFVDKEDAASPTGTSKARITFLDTPGHEAFSGIRERGAGAADIAVLVVSAEDGPKPQTLEAYRRIEESRTPFIVAITKIDKPNADVERVKGQLAENGILVEGYGGDVSMVAVSAKTGEGVKDLLDLILLLSELERCSGDASRWGSGIILESRLDPKRGILASGVVKDGTVKTGMFAAAPGTIAPLRFILDGDGNQVDSLSFSSPIQIAGWSKLPPVGAVFETFEDREAAEFYAESEALKHESAADTVSASDDLPTLALILKADTAGSLEAIRHELDKLPSERIRPKIIESGVGTISENDVKTALSTENAVVLGFNTKTDAQAAAIAERSGTPVETFDIIYKLSERVAELLAARTPKQEVEETLGEAKVLKLFSKTKDKQVLGARVQSGVIAIDATVKIVRQGEEIGRGRVRELQESRMAVDSVSVESEFGAQIQTDAEIAPGDMIVAFESVTK